MKAPIQKIKQLDHGDLQKSGFWVSQVFVVLATIIGVYLAANAGLEQAIRFDSIIAKEHNYYLRASLHDELQDNARELRGYVKDVLGRNPANLKDQHPALSQFVWETMRFSPATLETPSLFLTEGRRFYADTASIIEKVENHFYGATYAAKLLTELLDRMEQDTLPKLKANYQALGESLKADGVQIELLKEDS
ncbi:hypothetical protein [Allohahella marinimesophila]|uniref:Chemotaxis methyl-accepting receptor HlyB-like 4HB MCP domain-containing protein n=1 Tax=Allohahella marinimesophila TaxID=1054972 RepID=A0ABP7PGQ7_9GAMM